MIWLLVDIRAHCSSDKTMTKPTEQSQKQQNNKKNKKPQQQQQQQQRWQLRVAIQSETKAVGSKTGIHVQLGRG